MIDFLSQDDKHIIIWDVEQEKMIQKIAGNNSYVTCVAVNPKNGLIISGAYDHQVRMWDHRSRHALFRTLDAHSEPITALDFNEDGVEFLSGSYDGLVRIWQTLGGLCLQNLFLTELPPISGARFINNSYLSISSLDSHLRLWHRTQGESHKGKGRCRQVRMLTGHQNTKHCMLTTACNIIRSDGISANFLVSGSEDTNVYLWDLSSRELPAIALEGHCAPVVATASSQNKDLPAMIVSGDLDGQLKMWTASASS